MRRGIRAFAAAALALASTAAQAGWAITADAERFRWAESTEPGITESGPVLGLGGRYLQEKDAGWQFGWRGRLYGGSVHYSGAFLADNQPASGTTDYSGLVNEARGIYRFPDNPYGTELVGGLIWDYWNRLLSASQRERYWVASLRLGLNLDRRRSSGWFGGLGLKYPFYTREDARLTDIGFDSNPRLKPKGAVSLYADAGYRFSPRWSLTGYYDSYRFRESDPTPVVSNPAIPDCAAGCRLLQPASSVDSYGLRLRYSFQ